MKKVSSYLLLPVLLLFVIAGCKKEMPYDDPEPRIELVSVGPETVTALQDSITFTVYYQDGDGDLGENDPNVENLFVKDNRTDGVEGFRVQQLAPDNSNINIAGTLNVVLRNTGITDGSNSQSVTWDLWVVDRSNNQSNVVTTPAVTVQN